MDQRKCKECGKTLPISMFYVYKKDGHPYGICKMCKIAKSVDSQRNNWNQHLSMKKRLYWKYHSKETQRKKIRGYARAAIVSAIEGGLLTRPDVCGICGQKAKIEAHHYAGYEKEHLLDVMWLCPKCHRREHSKYLSELGRRKGAIENRP